jgi:hypothetical protein
MNKNEITQMSNFDVYDYDNSFDKDQVLFSDEDLEEHFFYDDSQHWPFLEIDQDSLFNIPPSNIKEQLDYFRKSQSSPEKLWNNDKRVDDLSGVEGDKHDSKSGDFIFESNDEIKSHSSSPNFDYAQNHDLEVGTLTNDITPVTPPNHRGRRSEHNGLTQRKDIVLKKVLRDIRGYYIKNFNELTKYNIRKKYSFERDSYIKCLSTYVNYEFGISDGGEIVYVLEKLFNYIETRAFHPSNDIHDALYNFTNHKLQILTGNASVRFLISHYDKNINKSNFTNDQRIGLLMVLEECKQAE